jgi:hypothetical protein
MRSRRSRGVTAGSLCSARGISLGRPRLRCRAMPGGCETKAGRDAGLGSTRKMWVEGRPQRRPGADAGGATASRASRNLLAAVPGH